MSEHVRVPGTDFRLWRWAALRGTGFPTSMVLGLAAEDAAIAAAAVLAAERDAATTQQAAAEALRSISSETGGSGDGGELGDLPRNVVRKALRVLKKGRIPEPTGTPADAAIASVAIALERRAAAMRAYEEAFGAARARISLAIRDAARDARILEAVTWQNRAAIRTAFVPFARAAGGDLRANDRRQELLIARYLQRYCTKNDSIGFFGPIGWARWEDVPVRIAAEPREELVESRAVYFEQWPIDVLAALASNDDRLRPWMTARRLPFVTLEGSRAKSPLTGDQDLSAAEAALLAWCDGSRTTRDLVADGRFGDADDVELTLLDLRDKQLIAWGFEVPLTWNPEAALRRALEGIDDEALRAEALAPVLELDEARKEVQAAAGDVGRLTAALEKLDGVFTDVTGAPASRNGGATYAGRQLVFEDCRRAGRVVLGQRLLDDLAPPLSLILASARWFTWQVGQSYDRALRNVYEDVARRIGDRVVPFIDVWLRAQRLLFGSSERPLDEVVAELDRRWGVLLDRPTTGSELCLASSEIRPRVDELFAAPHAGWTSARHHSPDLMLAAPSIEMIEQGKYTIVLGELHAGVNTLDTQAFLAQHPDLDALVRTFAHDLPEPRLVPSIPKDWPGVTVRTNSPLVTPATTILETSVDVADAPRDRVAAISDLVAFEQDGAVFVRSNATPAGRAPAVSPLPLLEAFAQMLTALTTGAFRVRGAGRRTPRVRIDRLVVARESWAFEATEIPFAGVGDECSSFLEARRWAAAHRLPRFVFVKSPLEFKPIFVDLESPLSVAMLGKIAHAGREAPGGATMITITEMHPGLDDCWLGDANGRRYTCEIRIVAVDDRSAR